MNSSHPHSQSIFLISGLSNSLVDPRKTRMVLLKCGSELQPYFLDDNGERLSWALELSVSPKVIK